ncbi:MAG: hypothetical protein ACKOQM_12125 [Novosphingobium sp.]
MKRLLLIALAFPSVLLAGGPNPGAPFVAADEAYTRAAETLGSKVATQTFSLPQSEIFVPQRIKTLTYGADLPNSPSLTHYRPQNAWISCDGTIGVTSGRWIYRGSKEHGWYEIIWAKMTDGSYRILMQHAGDLPRKLNTSPGRKGKRAACTGKPPPLPIVAPAVGEDFRMGASRDQSLIWSSAVNPAGRVRIVISLWDGTRHVPVLEDVAPEPVAR